MYVCLCICVAAYNGFTSVESENVGIICVSVREIVVVCECATRIECVRRVRDFGIYTL